MEKIISLYQRNYDGDRLVRNECVPGAEWVLEGEGMATVKMDGTCCMVRDGKLFARYEVRQGKKAPAGFEPTTEVNPVTGRQQGWRPVGENPQDHWHQEAVKDGMPPDGMYELLGPKVQSNPEGYQHHTLVPHGSVPAQDAPREFDALRDYLADGRIEGIVWRHPDGRMVKIKGRDFGIKRAIPTPQGRQG